MKQIITLFIVLSLQSITDTNHDIVGLWEHKGSSGAIFRSNFKKDGTFVSSIDKKAFTSGQYTFSNDTLTFVEDNVCTNANGVKFREVSHLVFFAKDSFRIDVLIDSCEGRGKAVNGSKYGRVKR